MFKNYLKIALRNIKQHKSYSFISIAGLTIGITCSFLILLYVRYELSYDRYHKNANEIYRVVMDPGRKYLGKELFNITPGALKSTVTEEFPEVLKSTRAGDRGEKIISNNGNLYEENGIRYADPEFLEIFSFPLLSGNRETALNEPFSLLLTEEMSRKYFGKEDPLGKILNIDKNDYKITGVLKNIPKNSHFTFNFLASFITLFKTNSDPTWIESWGPLMTWNTYILTKKNVNIAELEEKMNGLLKKHRKDKHKFHLQPITSIHLHSKVLYEAMNVSDIKYIYLFSAIGFLIMLIACLNYINLSTARSVKRAKEIGVRKIVGAHRNNLIKQFFGESIIFVLLAAMISIILSYLIIPSFGNFVERDLNFNMIVSGGMLLGLLGILIIVGIISGSYPAFFLSAFKPMSIIRGVQKSGSKSPRFRSMLVIFQLMISVMLIICSFVIYNQLEFIRNINLGFEKDHVIYGRVQGVIRRNFQVFKDEIRKNPDITDIYGLGTIPIRLTWQSFPDWEGKNEEERLEFHSGMVDYDFIDFFGIEIVKGRSFSKDYSTDIYDAWILNETAVQAIGWDDPIGKKFSVDQFSGKVIGIVKDFHLHSLHHKIEPVAFCLRKASWFDFYAVKVKSVNIPRTIGFLKEKFEEFSPDYPFNYYFLDKSVEKMYEADQKLGNIFNIFTLIAIMICCLGLFGLISFTTDQKTKEIGIRKIVGASTSGLVLMLTRESIKWLVIANVIAWPLAYYFMSRWHQNFAYRTPISLLIFLLACTLSLFIAVLTTGFRTIKAATANPVDSLRYE